LCFRRRARGHCPALGGDGFTNIFLDPFLFFFFRCWRSVQGTQRGALFVAAIGSRITPPTKKQWSAELFCLSRVCHFLHVRHDGADHKSTRDKFAQTKKRAMPTAVSGFCWHAKDEEKRRQIDTPKKTEIMIDFALARQDNGKPACLCFLSHRRRSRRRQDEGEGSRQKQKSEPAALRPSPPSVPPFSIVTSFLAILCGFGRPLAPEQRRASRRTQQSHKETRRFSTPKSKK
jgi:hypothetical protein